MEYISHMAITHNKLKINRLIGWLVLLSSSNTPSWQLCLCGLRGARAESNTAYDLQLKFLLIKLYSAYLLS